MKISVVIPALNEAGGIAAAVTRAGRIGDEIIVVDGGSDDGTEVIAAAQDCTVIQSQRGRGQQLNAGAAMATGDTLLFLHADTWLEPEGREQILGIAEQRADFYGGFRQTIQAPERIYRWIERGNAARATGQRLIYGDQGLFLSRSLFQIVGPLPNIELMEDFEYSRRLGKTGPPVLLDGPLHVDARRWQNSGPLKLTARNWLFAMAYRCGVSPSRLAAIYRQDFSGDKRSNADRQGES